MKDGVQVLQILYKQAQLILLTTLYCETKVSVLMRSNIQPFLWVYNRFLRSLRSIFIAWYKIGSCLRRPPPFQDMRNQIFFSGYFVSSTMTAKVKSADCDIFVGTVDGRIPVKDVISRNFYSWLPFINGTKHASAVSFDLDVFFDSTVWVSHQGPMLPARAPCAE